MDGHSPTHHSNVVPATTFPHFLDLPVELQDMIWEEAFPVMHDNPSVLCFKVDFVRNFITRTLCFTPIAHTAAYTRQHRILLGTCPQTRKKVLKFMPILDLYRFNPKTGKVSKYRIPFDLDKTGLCATGWMGLGVTFEGIGSAKGLSFAKDLTRLAFVVRGRDMEVTNHSTWKPSGQQARDDACRFALLFPNAAHIAAVHTNSLKDGKYCGAIPFLSLFSFQPFEQKTMVEGYLLLKSRQERCEALDRAIRSVFEGWPERRWLSFQLAAKMSSLVGEARITFDPWQIGGTSQIHQQS